MRFGSNEIRRTGSFFAPCAQRQKKLAQGGVLDVLISVELGLQFDQALFDGTGRLPDHLQCNGGRADVPRHARCKCTNWLGVGDSDQKQTLEKV